MKHNLAVTDAYTMTADEARDWLLYLAAGLDLTDTVHIEALAHRITHAISPWGSKPEQRHMTVIRLLDLLGEQKCVHGALAAQAHTLAAGHALYVRRRRAECARAAARQS